MKNDEIFNQLINQPCWRIWRGGGSAVFFELGKKLTNKDSDKPTQGEFSISLSSVKWSIQKSGKNLFSDDTDYKEMDNQISKLGLLTLKEIKFLDKEEIIEFDDGISVVMKHPRLKDEWYILTPANEVIISGSGVSVEDAE
jgi:hypothetical protein